MTLIHTIVELAPDATPIRNVETFEDHGLAMTECGKLNANYPERIFELVSEPTGSVKAALALSADSTITMMCGSLKKGDKIGRATVRYATMTDTCSAWLVYVEGDETPRRYGREEVITVTRTEVG